MSGPSSVQGPPITEKRQLVEYHASGCKPPEAWRVGTEHEKFVFRRSDLRRVPYEGPDGIGALMVFERDASGRVTGYVQGLPDGHVVRAARLRSPRGSDRRKHP